jgi:hypothetical protein
MYNRHAGKRMSRVTIATASAIMASNLENSKGCDRNIPNFQGPQFKNPKSAMNTLFLAA